MPGKPSADDGTWVRGAVDRFEAPLTLYAARLLHDAETARDVVQETFLRLCAQDRAAIEPRLAEWLFTVCRNRALDVLRKESRMTQLNEEQVRRCLTPMPGPADVAERRELASRVLDLLDSLPANQQDVVRLKFQNGFSYQEISRISGLSVSNVGYLLHHALKDLRSRMTDSQPAVQHGRSPSMPFDPDDPRLTAFALGELDESEKAAVEAEIADSDEARRFVADIRATADLLTEQLRKEPSPGLAPEQRLVIDR